VEKLGMKIQPIMAFFGPKGLTNFVLTFKKIIQNFQKKNKNKNINVFFFGRKS
jgi:hypothetical protein